MCRSTTVAVLVLGYLAAGEICVKLLTFSWISIWKSHESVVIIVGQKRELCVALYLAKFLIAKYMFHAYYLRDHRCVTFP